jgi:hypothetical protein
MSDKKRDRPYGHQANPGEDPKLCGECGRPIWRHLGAIWGRDSGYRHHTDRDLARMAAAPPSEKVGPR